MGCCSWLRLIISRSKSKLHNILFGIIQCYTSLTGNTSRIFIIEDKTSSGLILHSPKHSLSHPLANPVTHSPTHNLLTQSLTQPTTLTHSLTDSLTHNLLAHCLRGFINKNWKKLGHWPKEGGGVKNKTKMSKFQFENFWNPGEVSIFQICVNCK